MIIKCVKCKKEFEQKGSERKCSNRCKRYPSFRNTSLDYYNSPFQNYISHARAKFQNPILQWYFEFISTEKIPHPKTLNKIAKEQACECYMNSCLNEPCHDSSICECMCHSLAIVT